MSRIFSNPRPQFTKQDGVTINSNGKLYFREPGPSTTTLKSVYADAALTTALTNPVILDANGLAPSIFLNGDYNVQETDSNDVQVWRVDNYEAPQIAGQFNDWGANITYNINDFVRGSNGKYYQSLGSGNLANEPSTSPSTWVEIYFIDVWNSNKTYILDDIVKHEGSMYVSLQNDNAGNTPDEAGSAYWRSFFEPLIVTSYTAAGFEYRNTDGYNTTALSASAVIAVDTFESVGPTGSGADNTWTALDDLPDAATMAIVRCNIGYTRTATTDDFLSAFAYARTTGGAAATGFCEVAAGSDYGGAASNTATIIDRKEFTVPLDSENRFDFRYTVSGNNGGSGVNLQLVGYKL